MDPLTHAADCFMAALRLRLSDDNAQLTRLLAAASDRSSMLASLRLLEAQIDNHRPFVVAHENVDPYAALEQLTQDYAALGAALGRGGIALAPLDSPVQTEPLPPDIQALYREEELPRALATQQLAVVFARACRNILLGAPDHFDGLVLTLAPVAATAASHNTEAARCYRQLAGHLQHHFQRHPARRGHVLLYDAVGSLGAVVEPAVAFDIDEAALLDFLQDSSAAASEEAAERAPSATPAKVTAAAAERRAAAFGEHCRRPYARHLERRTAQPRRKLRACSCAAAKRQDAVPIDRATSRGSHDVARHGRRLPHRQRRPPCTP